MQMYIKKYLIGSNQICNRGSPTCYNKNLTDSKNNKVFEVIRRNGQIIHYVKKSCNINMVFCKIYVQGILNMDHHLSFSQKYLDVLFLFKRC